MSEWQSMRDAIGRLRDQYDSSDEWRKFGRSKSLGLIYDAMGWTPNKKDDSACCLIDIANRIAMSPTFNNEHDRFFAVRKYLIGNDFNVAPQPEDNDNGS